LSKNKIKFYRFEVKSSGLQAFCLDTVHARDADSDILAAPVCPRPTGKSLILGILGFN